MATTLSVSLLLLTCRFQPCRVSQDVSEEEKEKTQADCRWERMQKVAMLETGLRRQRLRRQRRLRGHKK